MSAPDPVEPDVDDGVLDERLLRDDQADLLLDDDQLADRLATRAGRLLLELREAWADGAPVSYALGDQGDRQSNRYLLEQLHRLRPRDAVLSEEAADDRRRLTADRVWIIDPLDGTREYRERGRADWAVHVALWAGHRLAAAAVALPAMGLTLSTATPPVVPERPATRSPRIVVSRSRPPAVAWLAAKAIGGELVTLGSAGAKAMAVVLGEVDAYIHTGGQYEWDSAAPVGVALAAGLHATRADGSPLVYNQPDSWLPDLVVCRPELARPILDAINHRR